MKYTEKIHAEALLKNFENHFHCACPLSSSRSGKLFDNEVANDDDISGACLVCIGFVGIEPTMDDFCPCWNVGKNEAIKRTWIALEEKGYI